MTTHDSCEVSKGRFGRILDLCMAPGGFLGTAMKLNPRFEAVAFSLPASKGGHGILLDSSVAGFNIVETRFLDISMLAADTMGVSRVSATTIPTQHPNAENFVTERQLPQTEIFDLVLCDGQVLRNHERGSYREGLRRDSNPIANVPAHSWSAAFDTRRNHDCPLTQTRGFGYSADSVRVQ